MHAIEIVARFETTVLDTVMLDRGASFRIGTAAGVDLPVELDATVTIIDGDLVRIPPAVTATLFEAGRARPVTGELTLGARSRVELQIGRVAIAIRWTLRPAPVPRAPIDRRPHAYTAATLVAHLVLVAVAAELAPYEAPPPPAPRPVRVGRIPDANPATREAPTPVPAAASAPVDPVAAPPPATKTPDVDRSRRARAIARARTAGILGSEGATNLSGLAPSDPSKAFEGVRPVYREEEARSRQFGGGDSWDPGGVVKMGRFSTRPNAGADYELAGATPAAKTVVDVCKASAACTFTGPLARQTVVDVLDANAEDILACHERHAGKRARGTVTLGFDIDRDGTVLRATSTGMGDVAGCVMRVVEKIAFPTAPGDAQTEVILSLEFHDS